MSKVVTLREEDLTPGILLSQILDHDDVTKILIILERGDSWLAHYCSGFTIEQMVLALELVKKELIESIPRERNRDA